MKNIIYKGIDYLKFPIRIDLERIMSTSIKDKIKIIKDCDDYVKIGYSSEGYDLVGYSLKEKKIKEICKKELKEVDILNYIINEKADKFIDTYLHSSIDFKGIFCHANQNNLKEKILEIKDKLKPYGIEILLEDSNKKQKAQRIDYCYDLSFESQTMYTRFVNKIYKKNVSGKDNGYRVNGKLTYFRFGERSNFFRIYDKKLDLYDLINNKDKDDKIKKLYSNTYSYLGEYSEVVRIELQKTDKSVRNLKWSFSDLFTKIEDNFNNMLVKKGISESDYKRLEKSDEYIESELVKTKVEDSMYNYTRIMKGFIRYFNDNKQSINYTIAQNKHNERFEEILKFNKLLQDFTEGFNKFSYIVDYIAAGKDREDELIRKKKYTDKIVKVIEGFSPPGANLLNEQIKDIFN